MSTSQQLEEITKQQESPAKIVCKLKSKNQWIIDNIQTKYCDSDGNIPLKTVLKNPFLLVYIEQTEEICKLAVKEDRRALWYIENKTEEICILEEKYSAIDRACAVDDEAIFELTYPKNVYALHYIKEHTKEIEKVKYIEKINKNFKDNTK